MNTLNTNTVNLEKANKFVNQLEVGEMEPMFAGLVLLGLAIIQPETKSDKEMKDSLGRRIDAVLAKHVKI